MTADRERLPNRRGSEQINFVYGDKPWTAAASRYPDGRIAEIFVYAGKCSDQSEMAADAAILASIALQHGAPFDVVKHAIADRGGPLAAALDALDGA